MKPLVEQDHQRRQRPIANAAQGGHLDFPPVRPMHAKPSTRVELQSIFALREDLLFAFAHVDGAAFAFALASSLRSSALVRDAFAFSLRSSALVRDAFAFSLRSSSLVRDTKGLV